MVRTAGLTAGLAMLALGPLFYNGHAADDGILHAALIHRGQRGNDAVGALEKINQVQMTISHRISHLGRLGCA